MNFPPGFYYQFDKATIDLTLAIIFVLLLAIVAAIISVAVAFRLFTLWQNFGSRQTPSDTDDRNQLGE